MRSSFNELADLFGWNDGEEESDHAENVKEDRHHDIAQFYDLEAAMHLKQWDDVTNICESDDAFPDLNFYAPIMDLTLQLDLPPALAIKVIKVRSFSVISDDFFGEIADVRMIANCLQTL